MQETRPHPSLACPWHRAQCLTLVIAYHDSNKSHGSGERSGDQRSAGRDEPPELLSPND